MKMKLNLKHCSKSLSLLKILKSKKTIIVLKIINESLIENQKYLKKVVLNEAIDRNVSIEFAKNCGQNLKYFDVILRVLKTIITDFLMKKN
jgi:hypothetical protein